MTTHRLAKIWKEKGRWHWYLILAGPGDASHARVYQGDEYSWRLAVESLKWSELLHQSA